MSLTICMVVYNEEKHLSLIEQNICFLRKAKRDIPILFIDNASTDQTSISLQKIAQQYSLDYILRDLNHLPQARQMALEHCRTDWLGFIDADCRLDEDWLNKLTQKIRDVSSDVVAIGGPWKMAGAWKNEYEALFSTFLGHFGLLYLQPAYSCEKMVRHLPTANIAYRCESVLKVGGFNSKNARVGEDLDLSQRLMDNKLQILFYPDMKIEHFLPARYLSWFYKMSIYGQARGEVLWNYKSFSYVSCIPFCGFLFLIGLFIAAPKYFVVLIALYLLMCFLVAVTKSRHSRVQRVFVLLVATHFFYSVGIVYGLLKQMLQVVLEQRPFLSGHTEQEPEGV